jgi:hypothetical protein
MEIKSDGERGVYVGQRERGEIVGGMVEREGSRGISRGGWRQRVRGRGGERGKSCKGKERKVGRVGGREEGGYKVKGREEGGYKVRGREG